MSLGLIIILIAALGYASNWLNWRYLNAGLVRFLYYIGAFVHETSHAILCLLTGAKIVEYKVLSAQPHVTHGRSRIPILGETLISIAPIFGGLLFLYLVNRFALGDYFFAHSIGDWQGLLREPLRLLSEIRFSEWQSWAMILLFLNVGAMLGPSFQDLKNIWPALILLFFASSSVLASLGLSAITLILAGILVQIVLILVVKALRAIGRAV